MASTAPDPSPYAFEDVRVDPRARRVLRAGVEVALEPKAFAVLLVLLREAGAVVPRDALLDEVWGHRHVTPAVLNRIIALLRRALGDDADHPRLIRTVYGTGYGFVGSVRREPLAPTAPAAAADAAAPTPAIEAQAPEPAAAVRTVPAEAPTTPTRTRIPRRLVMLGALALAALATWAWTQRSPEVVVDVPPPALPAPIASAGAPAPADPAASAPAPQRIAVLPLQADATDASLVAIANGLTDGLIETLARQPKVAVVERESSARVAADDPAAAIGLLSVDLLVVGRVSARDDDVRVEVELHRPGGAAPWIGRYERPRAQVFRVLGPLLDDLARVELPLTTEAGTSALRAAPEAVQDLYWRAQAEFAPAGSGALSERARTTLATLAELKAIAPDFALAHALEATVHTRLGVVGAVALDAAAQAATAAADRAIALDPDLAEGHLARGFAATMQWRSIEALGPARRALELAPNDSRALSLMANALAYAGRLDEARAHAGRAQALNPLTSWVAVRNNWATVLGGRKDDAFAEVATLNAQLGRTLANGAAPRIHLAYGEPAQALAAAGAHQPGEAVMMSYARAAALQVLGERQRARAELDAAAPLVPAMPMFGDLRLRDALLAGDVARFAARLREDPPIAQSPWREVLLATALAHAGERREALRLFSQAFADPHPRELLAYSWFATHNGVGAIADWVALRREFGVPDAPERAAHDAIVDGFVRGGVKVPMLAYHRAVGAALGGDAATADRLLGEAIASGWFDPPALRFDLAWEAHRTAPWFARRVAEVEARVRDERRQAGLDPR
jgi:DNA-binding winged helix-turn-helix (wHTH) protein/TolB-like protein